MRRGILALKTDLHQFSFPPKQNQLKATVKFKVVYCLGPRDTHTSMQISLSLNCAEMLNKARNLFEKKSSTFWGNMLVHFLAESYMQVHAFMYII